MKIEKPNMIELIMKIKKSLSKKISKIQYFMINKTKEINYGK
mgnify:CR=1 FL=1